MNEEDEEWFEEHAIRMMPEGIAKQLVKLYEPSPESYLSEKRKQREKFLRWIDEIIL